MLPQARARWKDAIPRALRLWRASAGPDADAALEEAILDIRSEGRD